MTQTLPRKTSRDEGSTLIELLINVAIIACMVGIVAPLYAD